MTKFIKATIFMFSAFVLSACNLTVENSGGGVVTSESGKINCGDTCTVSYNGTVTEVLTATPDEGHFFEGWTGSCEGSGICEVTITNAGDKKVGASFKATSTLADLPFTEELSENGMVLVGLSWTISQDFTVESVAKPGETIVLSGRGFSTSPEGNLIVAQTSMGAKVVAPVSGSETQLSVQLPQGTNRVFVVRDGFRSNDLDVQMLDSQAPVLSEMHFVSASPGETIRVEGAHFSTPLSAMIGAEDVDAVFLDSTTAEITVPANATDGRIVLKNSDLPSNEVEIDIINSIPAEVILPGGSPFTLSDIRVRGGGLNSKAVNSSGVVTIPVNRGAIGYIDVLATDSEGEEFIYLYGWSLPGTSSVELSSLSTAQVMVLHAMGSLSGIDMETTEHLMAAIESTPEVADLAVVIESKLAVDPRFLGRGDAEYFDAVRAAIIAVEETFKQSMSQQPNL